MTDEGLAFLRLVEKDGKIGSWFALISHRLASVTASPRGSLVLATAK